jgi:gas vesicle protein
MICLARCGGSDRPILAPVIGIGIGSVVGAAAGIVRAPARWVEVRIR